MKTTLSPEVQSARDFAVTQHGAQAYGAKPYAYHLDCVVETLADFGYDSTHQFAVFYSSLYLPETADAMWAKYNLLMGVQR